MNISENFRWLPYTITRVFAINELDKNAKENNNSTKSDGWAYTCVCIFACMRHEVIRRPTVENTYARSWWRHQMETFSALLAFCAGIHRSPMNSPHKGQWRGALMFSVICTRINGCANDGDAGDLRRHLAHYDVIIMIDESLLKQDSRYLISLYTNGDSYLFAIFWFTVKWKYSYTNLRRKRVSLL